MPYLYRRQNDRRPTRKSRPKKKRFDAKRSRHAKTQAAPIDSGCAPVACSAGAFYCIPQPGIYRRCAVDGDLYRSPRRYRENVVEVLVKDNQKSKPGRCWCASTRRDYQARVDQLRAALAMAASQARGAQRRACDGTNHDCRCIGRCRAGCFGGS